MFTWNFLYISKARLAETLGQLMLNDQSSDILIRIHTAIHLEDEAVDLARFIKRLVPRAQIFGTSTSAVIYSGKLLQNQCVISVTQMSKGSIKTVLMNTFDSDTGMPLSPDETCLNLRDTVISPNAKLMLTFLTRKYLDVYGFVDKCNEYFPGVQMIGGLANSTEISLQQFLDSGFVFNEKSWSNKGIIAAVIGGKHMESYSSYATGVQVMGSDHEITDTFGTCILSIDGKDAAEVFRTRTGDEIKERPELTNLFPYVYSDASDIPIFVRYSDNSSISEAFPPGSPANERFYAAHSGIDKDTKREMINANHNVTTGKKLRRAFICDRKIVSDNLDLFRRIQGFDKAETIFAYSCIARSMFYSNCVKWELSAYENSNMCGCITEGEIAHVNGRNTFANCSFVISAIGETKAFQQYNPYAFSHTESLVADNAELLKYLMDKEQRYGDKLMSEAPEELSSFVKCCEEKLFKSEIDNIPNSSAMEMDIRLHGYDLICMINVFDTSSMMTVFSEEMIEQTYNDYLSKCVEFAAEHNYSAYIINKWLIAVGAQSEKVPKPEFIYNMQSLQKQLFEAPDKNISIVPMFCVIDGCTAENIDNAYNSGRIDMMKRNIQFYIRDTRFEQLDEDSIRERYHMVNVINHAIAHDKVIPYYQGIYDNNSHEIHHYESLMRLEDENGKIYYPGSFLDVARSYGLLYDTISVAMIRKVFERFMNVENKSVSINLGVRDISNTMIVDYIYDRLSSAKHPENFVFEILENEEIEDYDEIITFVDMIHELGGKISIDDFGSGYSNLQHVANIHCDYLKIDGSIVKNCCTDEQSENLIALIAGWKTISTSKFKIIAEFVENKEIQELITGYGIDFSQGYLFSKPAPEPINM